MKSRLLYLGAGVYLLLHLVTGFWDPLCAWGLHLLAFYPSWVRLLFVAFCGLVLVFIAMGSMPQRWPLNRGFLYSGRIEPPPYLGQVILVAGGIFLFVLLRSAVHLLGDGYLLLRELPLGLTSQIWRTGHEPLSLRLIGVVYGLGQNFGWTPENVYRVVSILSGVAYLLVAMVVAAAVGRTRGERVLVLGFLLTTGFMQFFCGYVETYPLLMPTALVFLLTGLRAAEEQLPLWVPAAVLGLAIPLHFTMVTLVPSLLTLPWLRHRRGETGGGSDKVPWVLEGAAALAIAASVAMAILLALGVDIRSYLEGLRASHFLPFLAEPDEYQPYRLLSWGHLFDLTNQLLLVSPAAILVIPLALGGWKGDWQLRRFLMVAAAFPVLFTWLANPEIGAFRDWDVLSLPALPLSLWTAVVVRDRIRADDLAERAGLVVCIVAAMHMLLWVGLNARADSAVARYTHILENGALSQHARVYGWETLGGYHATVRGDHMAALQAYDRARTVNPGNPRYWNLAGMQYAALGRYDEAISLLGEAIRRQPDTNPKHLNNLASVYAETGQHEMAVRCLQQAVALQPDFVEGYQNLGLAQARLGRFAEAVVAFQEALILEPANSAILKDKGMALTELGRFEDAISVLNKALAAMPNDPDLHFYLGLAYGRSGRTGEAKYHLQRVLELRPDHPQAEAITRLVD